MTNTEKHALQTMIEMSECGLELRAYSGRGMGGAECLAITGTLAEILPALVAVALHDGPDFNEDDRDRIISALASVRTDSMGMGQIAYFPGVAYTAGDEPLADLAALLNRRAMPNRRANGVLTVGEPAVHRVTVEDGVLQVENGPAFATAQECADALEGYDADHADG